MSTAAPQRPAPASDIAVRPAPADSALRRILSGNGTVTALAILLSLLVS
ncbi:ABC transporter permease, partial [Xanthomonas citri pv. citri]|nr:ABC transporter permease [Xanthomonas citri pv. citri]